MLFEFRGRLCGFLCSDCQEDLSGVTVRLYRNRKDQNITGLSVASPDDTLAIVDEQEIASKKPFLIAETETAADGSFSFRLGPEQKYDGGPFEVDVYCSSVPYLKQSARAAKPLQFSITTLQPMWKQAEEGQIAFWQYCIPYRFWCAFRHRFGAWTICGHVYDCNRNRVPVAGVKVSAFDVDWIQDDALGSAITNSAGHFRIDYLEIDFKRTPFPFINVEWFGGPDLYFKVQAPDGSVILDEPPSRGRGRDRENAGPCFCVDLCVDTPVAVKHAWFTHVGDFDIKSDIDSLTGTGTGKTKWAAPVGLPSAHGGPGFGFYDGPLASNRGLKLKGDCSATHPSGGDPMRYRFLYEDLGNPGTLVPITGSLVRAQQVGTRPVSWDFGFGPVTTFQSIWVAGSGGTTSPPPPPVPAVIPPPGTSWGPVPPAIIIPDSDGWVIVDPSVTNGALSGTLIGFLSSVAVPGGDPTSAGDSAGNPPVSPKNSTVLRIIFEAEPTGGPTSASPKLSNELSRILINNWAALRELAITQFGSDCCTPLTNQLGVKYTTDHDLMRSWSVGISSCASTHGWSAPSLPSGPNSSHPNPRGDAGTDNINIGNWPGCSYLMSLTTVLALTYGEDDDPGATNWITFCIDR